MAESTFIKLGSVLINPNQIVSVSLDYEDYQTGRKDCVAIVTVTGDVGVFEEEEAETLRRYFLHGSRAIDLENLYWVEKP